MLLSLFLRDFVIVAQAEIDFSAGFCALSGETGAGKSILLDALGLALGNRSDAGMVREGAKQTEISATFRPGNRVSAWLHEHELAGIDDEPELQLRRIITSEGRSKAFVNGSPVTVGQLRELGEQLIEIHGQHASQSLLVADGQRKLLDDFARPGALPEQVLKAWTDWRESRQLLDKAQSRQDEIKAEREQVQWRLDEISTVAPLDNEWHELSAEQTRLANAAGLIQETQSAATALAEEDDSIRDRIGHLVQRLRNQARLDPGLENALQMLESAEIQITEAASELSGYAEAIDLDPSRLSLVESRVSDIFQLARKLRCEPEDLQQAAVELNDRLSDLDRAQDIDALTARVDELADQYQRKAKQLSAVRRKAAATLSGAVNKQLGGLGMPGARFQIALGNAEPGPHGIDKLAFEFASHKSMTPRSLARVASGGELSRVSLAIAVSAAEANPVDTLIFDEADAGVGGAVADAIGQMMRSLGHNRQVLAVTHLPQVAACAHRHFRISKGESTGALNSQVNLLDTDARIEELARMLGGARITATSREHASELIALAERPGKVSSAGKKKTPTKAKAASKPRKKASR